MESNSNKGLKTQAVTKLELPKYQAEQNPTYRIDSLEKEIDKKLFAKADSLVDKILYCHRFKLTNLQTLILDDVETGVILLNFSQQLRCKKADGSDI